MGKTFISLTEYRAYFSGLFGPSFLPQGTGAYLALLIVSVSLSDTFSSCHKFPPFLICWLYSLLLYQVHVDLLLFLFFVISRIKAARWSQATSLNLVALVWKGLCLELASLSSGGLATSASLPNSSCWRKGQGAKGEEGTAPPQAVAAPGPQSSCSRQQRAEAATAGFPLPMGQARPLHPQRWCSEQ